MREAGLAAMETDPARCEKHVTHHVPPGFPSDWMEGARVAFPVRDPVEIGASCAAKRETCTRWDIGLDRQPALFDRVSARRGPPRVVDAHDIRCAPEATLRTLCAAPGLGFKPPMLTWPPCERRRMGRALVRPGGAVDRLFPARRTDARPPPALAAVAGAACARLAAGRFCA